MKTQYYWFWKWKKILKNVNFKLFYWYLVLKLNQDE